MGRAFRSVAKVLLAIPLALLGLAILGWLALQVRPVRAAILDRVLPRIEASLQGSLAVEDVRTCGPSCRPGASRASPSWI